MGTKPSIPFINFEKKLIEMGFKNGIKTINDKNFCTNDINYAKLIGSFLFEVRIYTYTTRMSISLYIDGNLHHISDGYDSQYDMMSKLLSVINDNELIHGSRNKLEAEKRNNNTIEGWLSSNVYWPDLVSILKRIGFNHQLNWSNIHELYDMDNTCRMFKDTGISVAVCKKDNANWGIPIGVNIYKDTELIKSFPLSGITSQDIFDYVKELIEPYEHKLSDFEKKLLDIGFEHNEARPIDGLGIVEYNLGGRIRVEVRGDVADIIVNSIDIETININDDVDSNIEKIIPFIGTFGIERDLYLDVMDKITEYKKWKENEEAKENPIFVEKIFLIEKKYSIDFYNTDNPELRILLPASYFISHRFTLNEDEAKEMCEGSEIYRYKEVKALDNSLQHAVSAIKEQFK